MTSPIDTELLPPSGAGARLPALGAPESSPEFLARVKEILETLLGRRGSSQWDRAVTFRDLYESGLAQPGGFGAGAGGAGAVLAALPPSIYAMMLTRMEADLRNSAVFKTLQRQIGSLDDLAIFPDEIRSQLTQAIADVARQRQADIQTVEHKIQTSALSMASRLTEITASLNQAAAGVRSLDAAYADQMRALATSLTQVAASLGNLGGVTVEEKFLAQADVNDGLLGQWSVKIQLDADGHPIIAGIGLSVEAPVAGPATSNLVFQADKFGFFSNGGAVMPFGIDGTTGQVFINGALLINAGGKTLGGVVDDMITYVGEFAAAPDPALYAVNNVYKNTTDGNSYILKAGTPNAWALWMEKGGAGTPGAPGTPGANAKNLSLSATSQVFQITKASANAPASITFIANPQNLAGTPAFSVTAGSATLGAGADGMSKVLTFANMASDAVTVQVAQDGLTDSVTVIKVREGSDAITGLLTNEAVTLTADSAGTVASFAGAGGTFMVFDGTADKTGSAGVTYAVASQTACTVSISTTGVYTVSSMSADNASAVLQATYRGVVLQKTLSLSKSKAGLNGTGSAYVVISDTGQVFARANVSASYAPASLTLTATPFGGTATYQWQYWTGTAWSDISGETAATLIVGSGSFTSARTYQVLATIGGTVYTDQTTLVQVTGGTNAVTGFLTNESATVPASTTGTVSSFANANGTFKVFDGLTDETGTVGVTYSANSISAGLTISIASSGAYTVTALSNDSGNATLRAVYNGVTIDKVYTIVKAKTGATGATGTGSTGPQGQRGTVNIASAGNSSWTDSAANAAISGAGYGSPIDRDVVTLYGTSFSETRFYSSGSWLVLSAYINGNMLVTGTLSCAKLQADTMTGQTYRTAASGQRVTINESSNNLIKVYDSSGMNVASFGGGSGYLTVQAGPSSPGIFATCASSATHAIIASASAGNGISASAGGTGAGVITTNSSSGPALSAQGSSGPGATISSSTGNALVITGGANGIVQSGGGANFLFGILPVSDNSYSLGASSNRWANVYVASGVISTSDARTKTDVAPSDLGLDFIAALRPVKYRQIVAQNVVTFETVELEPARQFTDDFGDTVEIPAVTESRQIVTPRAGVRFHYGLIAQEVRAALVAAGTEDAACWTLADPADPDSQQALRYEEFIAPLIKATQELSAIVTAQQARIDALEARVAQLETTP
jgi:hypothetical protein